MNSWHNFIFIKGETRWFYKNFYYTATFSIGGLLQK